MAHAVVALAAGGSVDPKYLNLKDLRRESAVAIEPGTGLYSRVIRTGFRSRKSLAR